MHWWTRSRCNSCSPSRLIFILPSVGMKKVIYQGVHYLIKSKVEGESLNRRRPLINGKLNKVANPQMLMDGVPVCHQTNWLLPVTPLEVDWMEGSV